MDSESDEDFVDKQSDGKETKLNTATEDNLNSVDQEGENNNVDDNVTEDNLNSVDQEGENNNVDDNVTEDNLNSVDHEGENNNVDDNATDYEEQVASNERGKEDSESAENLTDQSDAKTNLDDGSETETKPNAGIEDDSDLAGNEDEKKKVDAKMMVDTDKDSDTSADLTASLTDAEMKRKKPLSSRLEYLSRSKKDIIDGLVSVRLDGALPENAYPSWNSVPLPTKLPFADCPIPVTKKKLGTNLFLPPPANDFDLADENNLRLPSTSYENLHDPNLKDYVDNKSISEHLAKKGFITESGTTTCSLGDINRYRTYQRRILAAEVQKKLRDEDEIFRRERAKGMEEKVQKDILKHHERRTQANMRRYIKHTIASIKDSSMEKQMKRDRQVLNCRIRRQIVQKTRVQAAEDKYNQIFERHMSYKYGDDKQRKKKMHLAYAKKDLNRSERLCKVQEKNKMERKEKLDEFWKRKSDWQKKWIKEGEELERKMNEERERNIETLKTTGKLPVIFLKKEEKVSTKEPTQGEKNEQPSKEKMDAVSETRKARAKEEIALHAPDKEIDKSPLQEEETKCKEDLETKTEHLKTSESDFDKSTDRSSSEEVDPSDNAESLKSESEEKL